jgi:hypothetical protein
MNEATCKAALCRLLRESVVPRGGIVYRHEDTFTGGIPDISVNLDARTVWAEVKFDKPGRKGKLTALQEAALTSLHGLEVHYALDKERVLSCRVTDFRSGAVLCHVRSGNKTVHRMVAATLLARLVGEA